MQALSSRLGFHQLSLLKLNRAIAGSRYTVYLAILSAVIGQIASDLEVYAYYRYALAEQTCFQMHVREPSWSDYQN